MTELHYIDPETGKRVVLDMEGWQFIIATSAGEVCRMDFPMLALMVRMRAAGAPTFRASLLSFDERNRLVEPSGFWMDVLVEKR